MLCCAVVVVVELLCLFDRTIQIICWKCNLILSACVALVRRHVVVCRLCVESSCVWSVLPKKNLIAHDILSATNFAKLNQNTTHSLMLNVKMSSPTLASFSLCKDDTQLSSSLLSTQTRMRFIFLLEKRKMFVFKRHGHSLGLILLELEFI